MNVVLMFMGDEDPLDLLDVDPDRAEPEQNLRGGEPGIDQNPLPRPLSSGRNADITAIPPASAP